MPHDSPDLDLLRTIADHALHGTCEFGVRIPPQTHVTITARSLDCLLRSADPAQMALAAAAHDSMRCVTVHRELAIVLHQTKEIAAAAGDMNRAIAEDDTEAVRQAARTIARLTHEIQETHRP